MIALATGANKDTGKRRRTFWDEIHRWKTDALKKLSDIRAELPQ